MNGLGANIELVAAGSSTRPTTTRRSSSSTCPASASALPPRRLYRMRHVSRLAEGLLALGHGRPTCSASPGAARRRSSSRAASRRAAAGWASRHRARDADGAGAPGGAVADGDAAALYDPRHARSSPATSTAGFPPRPRARRRTLQHVRWQSRPGYYLQLGAVLSWTSIPWLDRLRQPTLIMAGTGESPSSPRLNARPHAVD